MQQHLEIYFPRETGTTAQIVHIIDRDEESGDVKIEVIGRTDGSRRSVGATKWMKAASLEQNYHLRMYVREDAVDRPVELGTEIELYGSRYYPLLDSSPEPKDDISEVEVPDLFSLIEQQSQRITEIGTVNTDILKELRQIRGLLARYLSLSQEEEDPEAGRLVEPLAPYQRPQSTDELTSVPDHLAAH